MIKKKDNCPNPTIQQTAGPASGSLFPPGVTTITYTATDAGRLTATCPFTVTVSPDAHPPVIVGCPANIGRVAMDAGACGALVSWTALTVTDNCPNPAVHQRAGAASGSLFPPGITTVTYTATDAGGLTATCTFTVTVSPDAQAPVIAGCPANIGPVAMDAGGCGALVSWTAASVTDKCPTPTIQQTAGPASGSLFPPGITTVTY